jgi:hypothetical protein
VSIGIATELNRIEETYSDGGISEHENVETVRRIYQAF